MMQEDEPGKSNVKDSSQNQGLGEARTFIVRTHPALPTKPGVEPGLPFRFTYQETTGGEEDR